MTVYVNNHSAIQRPMYLPLTVEPTKAGTCAHDRRALQLALNSHVKHSDMTWPKTDVTKK